MTIRPFIALLSVTIPSILFSQTFVSGTLTSDTEWKYENSPYLVTSSVAIASGVTLTIEPGVKVFFKERTGISVRGNLYAIGSASDSITFIAEDQTDYNWIGIDIRNNQGANK